MLECAPAVVLAVTLGPQPQIVSSGYLNPGSGFSVSESNVLPKSGFLEVLLQAAAFALPILAQFLHISHQIA